MPGSSVKKFRIDRSKWRAGKECPSSSCGKGSTQLLNGDGFMCCLGFASLQLGASEKDIRDKSVPGEAVWQLDSRMNSHECSFISEAIEANDNASDSLIARELRVGEVFGNYGFEIEFYGEPVISSG